jgi:hypothetical protein
MAWIFLGEARGTYTRRRFTAKKHKASGAGAVTHCKIVKRRDRGMSPGRVKFAPPGASGVI